MLNILTPAGEDSSQAGVSAFAAALRQFDPLDGTRGSWIFAG
jgi:hypothetical protein